MSSHDAMVLSLITTMMRDLSVKNRICAICKSSTDERVSGLCASNCEYFCHDHCLAEWIRYKQNDASCIMCTIPYPVAVIDRVMFNSSRFNRMFSQKAIPLTVELRKKSDSIEPTHSIELTHSSTSMTQQTIPVFDFNLITNNFFC